MGRKMWFCLKNISGRIPGVVFFVHLWRSPGKLQPHKAPARSWDGDVEEFPQLGSAWLGWTWSFNHPAAILGCSCAGEHEHQVLVLLVEHHSHTKNIWWVPSHEPWC